MNTYARPNGFRVRAASERRPRLPAWDEERVMVAADAHSQFSVSADRERALQLRLQSLLLSLRTLYFEARSSVDGSVAPMEQPLLTELHLVGEQLKAINPENWA